MNEQDNRLTLQETEQLCELFMDCKISVLQENELRYVLSHVHYHSPLINDVRTVMRIELSTFDKPVPKTTPLIKRWWTKKMTYLSIAASIAFLICFGVELFHNSYSGFTNNTSEYIAYVDGHQLSQEAAKAQVEADILIADSLLNEIETQEKSDKTMIDNFFNN